MGTSMDNSKVQKGYRPEDQHAPKSSNVLTVPNQSKGIPPRPPTSSQAGPKNGSTSIIREPGGSGTYLKGSNVNDSRMKDSKDRVVQLNQSKIYYKSEKAVESSTIISAIRIKGMEGEQYEGKKVKRFHISADIPERELIKESNYFQESNGDLNVKPLVPTKYADFTVGEFNQLNTLPVKTYLFDVSLKERIQA